MTSERSGRLDDLGGSVVAGVTRDRFSRLVPVRQHRAGFSLIELLVVIGILAVLISLAVIGFKVVGTASREKVTDNQLENCRSLLAAYELTSSPGNLLTPVPVGTNGWLAPVDTTKPNNVLYCRMNINNAIEAETARVMARLQGVTANRQSIEKMTPDRVRSEPFAAIAPLPAGNAPVLLDGDGRTIYFVPGGGLVGVNRAYRGSGDRTLAASYDAPNSTVSAPDRRPFWVSPGPDGNLTTGDDNLYSFGK